MCVGFWSLNVHEYSLVLCTNRDEYLSRPTEPAHWHSFDSLKPPGILKPGVSQMGGSSTPIDREGSVLSGIDSLAGGTWFGINEQGDVALLTNVTEPAANLHSSRGHLCSSFLRRRQSIPNADVSQYVNDLITSDMRYSGFNLLLLSPSHLPHTGSPTQDDLAQKSSSAGLQYTATFLSNGGAGKPIGSVPINGNSSGCGGISNGVPNGIDPFTGLQTCPEWPKVVQGRSILLDVLSKPEGEDILVNKLFGLLRSKRHSPPLTRQAFQETILIDPLDLGTVRKGPSFAQTHHQGNKLGATVNNQKAEVPPKTTEHGETPSHPQYYATRLSTVLLVRRSGEVLFIERDVWHYGHDGKPQLAEPKVGNNGHERRFRFRVA